MKASIRTIKFISYVEFWWELDRVGSCKVGKEKHLLQESKAINSFLTDEHPVVTELHVLYQATAQVVKQLLGVLR